MTVSDRPQESASPAVTDGPPRCRPAEADQTIASFILRPFLLPLLLLLAVGASVLLAVNGNARTAAQVAGAQGRLTLITALLRDTADLERGQRGFVITGSETFLKPYTEALRLFPQHVQQLRAVSATDKQRVNLNRVVLLVEAWDRQAAQPEIAARRASISEAVALVSDGSGKRTLDEARQVLAIMEGNENSRLQAALAASNRTLQTLRWVTVGGLLLGILLCLMTALRAARTVSMSLRQITVRAAQLAQGDDTRTLPPTPLRELNALGDQFHVMVEAVRQREQALRTTNEALERSNRELEQFAYVASHDLQEPLRTIGSYTELLSKRYRGKLDDRADQYIDFTISATQRLKHLIQDLLAYSRVRQAARMLTPVHSAQVVAQALEDMQTQIASLDAQIEVAELPLVHANPELLRHIFLNLIGNALKFRMPGRRPQIRVSAHDDGQHWVFAVQDNGIGIEPQYHERIFGVFQRLHGLDEYSGSGIGLAVTRTAAEQQGGHLWLTSTPGEGSTFFFALPHPTADLLDAEAPLDPAPAGGP